MSHSKSYRCTKARG